MSAFYELYALLSGILYPATLQPNFDTLHQLVIADLGRMAVTDEIQGFNYPFRKVSSKSLRP